MKVLWAVLDVLTIIVLVSGIFTAFLLAPLAMPVKKERKRK